MRIACFDQSWEKRWWSINFEVVRRTKLVLISNHDDLLGIKCCKESFMLLYHRSFIHHHSFESTFNHCFCWSRPNSRNYTWKFLQNFLFKLFLMLKEDLELLLCKFFYRFEVEPEYSSHFLINLGISFSYIVNEVIVPLLSINVNNYWLCHHLVDICQW